MSQYHQPQCYQPQCHPNTPLHREVLTLSQEQLHHITQNLKVLNYWIF